MKFGKSLSKVIELSNPEWGPFWMNYKLLKKNLKEFASKVKPKIEEDEHSIKKSTATTVEEISSSQGELKFFMLLKQELKKVAIFFNSTEEMYRIRHERIVQSFNSLKELDNVHDNKEAWKRLLSSCVQLYKDIILLENFAIMNYCAFSKILKKHDKKTGFSTKEAFVNKILSKQNFTRYPTLVKILQDAEDIFEEIKAVQCKVHSPSLEEGQLFIDAIRDLHRISSDENLNKQISDESVSPTSAEENSSSDDQQQEPFLFSNYAAVDNVSKFMALYNSPMMTAWVDPQFLHVQSVAKRKAEEEDLSRLDSQKMLKSVTVAALR